MNMLIGIWLSIAITTWLISHGISKMCERRVEPKLKLNPDDAKLKAAYGKYFILYHVVMVTGILLLAICSFAILYSFTIYVFSCLK